MAKLYDVGVDTTRQTIWRTPIRGVEQTAVFCYDFDVMGGAIGAYLIGTIPANSIINETQYIATTAMVGDGDVDTVGTTIDSGAELVADLAATSADTLTEGVCKIENNATWIKCAADTPIYFNIATAVATAGKVYVFVRYINMPTA